MTPDERLICELLVQGPRAVLGGLTAATLDGLKNFSTASIFILLPASGTPRPREDVVVKRSRLLVEADVHPVKRPRRTRLPRSIVDAASWASTDLRAQAILASGVQQGLVTPQALQLVADANANLLRRAIITETITDVAGGSLSVYEILFIRLCRRFGFPEPTRQRRRRDASGRWRYLDADFDEYYLVVEIDGQQHIEALAWWEDMMRQNEIVVDDRKEVLRFAGFALRHQPERIAQVMERFFSTRTPRRTA
jgi:hypothetical protein